MSERERICACAEQANHRYQQWMPQRWLEFFIEAWEASASAPPADVAGRIEHLKYLLLTPRGRNGEVRLTAETVQGTIDALAALAGERDRLLSVMRRVQDCWNNYHGDLGSQKPGAEQYAREIQWPALLVAMEDFEGVLCNAEDTRAALGGSEPDPARFDSAKK